MAMQAQIIPPELLQGLAALPVATAMLALTAFVVFLAFRRLPEQNSLTKQLITQLDKSSERYVAAEDRHYERLNEMKEAIESIAAGHIRSLDSLGERLVNSSTTIVNRMTTLELTMNKNAGGVQALTDALTLSRDQWEHLEQEIKRLDQKISQLNKRLTAKRSKNTEERKALADIVDALTKLSKELHAHVQDNHPSGSFNPVPDVGRTDVSARYYPRPYPITDPHPIIFP